MRHAISLARISWSMDYETIDGKSERLLSLCRQTRATEYLSGPSAKDYLDAQMFEEQGVAVRWMDYSSYPEYHQLYCPPFVHEVSIIDLILNEGVEGAKKCMLSFRQAQNRNSDG